MTDVAALAERLRYHMATASVRELGAFVVEISDHIEIAERARHELLRLAGEQIQLRALRMRLDAQAQESAT